MDPKEQRKLGGMGLLREEYKEFLKSSLPSDLRSRTGSRVISVGCGFAEEVLGIQTALPGVHYEGIDISPAMIKAAKIWNPELPEEQFRVADATFQEAFGQKQWDVIVLRNPKIFGDVEDAIHGRGMVNYWKVILRNCAASLKNNGYILVSSVFAEDIDAISGFFQGLTTDQSKFISAPKMTVDFEARTPFTENYYTLIKKMGTPKP